MAKLHWENLTPIERSEYMYLQMAPSGGYDHSGYLADDCSECNSCSQPMLGSSGLCPDCYARWKTLRDKLEAK